MEEHQTAKDELLVGVGLTGSRRSMDILKWAMERFLQVDNVRFKLLHVYPKITVVPSPFGGWLPIAEVREDIAARYRQEIEWKGKKLLLPYQKILKANQVSADIVVVESEDVAMAISLEIDKLAIRHLVIGLSSAWRLSWRKLSVRMGKDNLSSVIVDTAPSFCSVSVVAARKLEHSRPSDSEQNVIGLDDKSALDEYNFSFSGSDSFAPITQPKKTRSLPYHRAGSRDLASKSTKLDDSFLNMHLSLENPNVVRQSSNREDSKSWVSGRINPGGSFVGSLAQNQSHSLKATPSQLQQPAGSETLTSAQQSSDLEELRTELRNGEEMYELAQNSVINAMFLFPLNQLNDDGKRTVEQMLKLEKHKELTITERNKLEAAYSESMGSGENENKLKQQLESSVIQCQKFTLKEILKATSSFSDKCKIGAGAFGSVYKCKLNHTTVAVKILHSKNSATDKQFLQELEILSKIRHPHLLLLLGAVPEENCLVYEYMENGSLEDLLFRKDNKPPLPWYDRFRICWEMASALAFLHNRKPTPIIHRDLKPANILLDQHLVSKIGDAGLGTMVNEDLATLSIKTLYKETSPVGTLCYIDPEYQRTGKVSTKSDIYAFGVVILQLLTAKTAVGISYTVEDAIKDGTLMEILDPEAGNWPEKEALDLASLGLQCAELSGRDRPDLMKEILPVLERLKEVADGAQKSATTASTAPPVHFICPIQQDIMRDPYVAADGYTYERSAIEQWLAENSTSPTTNLPLPHKIIMPNTVLIEAIKDWRSKNQTR